MQVMAAGAHAWALVRRPRDLALLIAASASTTVLMGVALLCSALAVPTAHLRVPALLVVIAYTAGAAAGSATGAPAALGVTKAGLLAALGFCGVAVSPAVQAVLQFRLVTFWLPALLGLPSARRLPSRGHV